LRPGKENETERERKREREREEWKERIMDQRKDAGEYGD